MQQDVTVNYPLSDNVVKDIGFVRLLHPAALESLQRLTNVLN